MGVLSGLEPERVFYYFEKICQIPHGSYHEKAISDYLVSFAKAHGLKVYQDEFYNVLMFVDASEGYENEEPVILQGHMDMVCEKKAEAQIDMEKEGLQLQKDEKYVYAKDTTLGGDDGIAIAYMLAIAESKEIAHPPLELIITVSEEVGMEGAANIDLSMLKGRRMLNLDSEEEGIFLSSCAGGMTICSTIPVQRKQVSDKVWYELSVEGLLGGHSGCEIDKGRANAIRILGRVLFELNKELSYTLWNIEGGKKDNAIPLLAVAGIGIEQKELLSLQQFVMKWEKILQDEYIKTDTGIKLVLRAAKQVQTVECLVKESLDNMLALLMTLPEGIQGMSQSVKGLVETSLNLGIMRLEQEKLFLQHSIRSSVTTKKKFVAEQVECLVKQFGGSVERKGEYPAWEYREESVVRPRAIALYERMYQKTPVVEGIHAGLECGLLAEKLPGLDCVAMGPDILDIHTTAERLDIESTRRVYEFLIEYLKIKDGE